MYGGTPQQADITGRAGHNLKGEKLFQPIHRMCQAMQVICGKINVHW